MSQCEIIGAEEDLGELKEVDAQVVEPELVTACPHCGCRHFTYCLWRGVGIKRLCLVCKRRVDYRE